MTARLPQYIHHRLAHRASAPYRTVPYRTAHVLLRNRHPTPLVDTPLPPCRQSLPSSQPNSYPDPNQPPASAPLDVAWRRVSGTLYFPNGKGARLLQVGWRAGAGAVGAGRVGHPVLPQRQGGAPAAGGVAGGGRGCGGRACRASCTSPTARGRACCRWGGGRGQGLWGQGVSGILYFPNGKGARLLQVGWRAGAGAVGAGRVGHPVLPQRQGGAPAAGGVAGGGRARGVGKVL